MAVHVRRCETPGGAYQAMLVQQDAHRPATRCLYLLDGNAALTALQPDWVERNPDVALVAIGYPGTSSFDPDRRSLDYTPAPPSGWDGGARRALARPHGGAAAFLARLTGEIVPAAEALLGARRLQRELWGHSYGGLFALWMLTQEGHGFAGIHAASPSLWWGGYVLERQLMGGDALPRDVRHVSLSMGDSEVSRTGERLYDPERLSRLASALRRHPELACSVSVFAGAGHEAAFARSLELAVAGPGGRR